jgi:hypothetical protein
MCFEIKKHFEKQQLLQFQTHNHMFGNNNKRNLNTRYISKKIVFLKIFIFISVYASIRTFFPYCVSSS